jgi:hypothetical protein
VEFEITGDEVNGEFGAGLSLKKVNDLSKIIGIQVRHNDEDEYASTLKYVEEQKAQKANEKQEQDRQAQALRESQTARNSQSNSNSSSNSNNSYKRSYRDKFDCRSAVFEFLANHTFSSSDGTRIKYDMSTLSITFSSGKSALFTNVDLLGYNQNIARIHAICTNVSGYSTTLTLNSSYGTITDSDGAVFKAGN